jgi:hypothetical protein
MLSAFTQYSISSTFHVTDIKYCAIKSFIILANSDLVIQLEKIIVTP